MPQRRYQVAIILLWGVSSTWFVNQELSPQLKHASNTYRDLTWRRAVEETTRWSITSGKQAIGSASTRVRPLANGTHRIRGILSLNSLPRMAPDMGAASGNTMLPEGIHVELDLTINPAGRLTHIAIEFSITGTHLKVSCLGTVTGDHIHFQVQGLEEITGIPRTFDYPFRSETAYWETYAPRDRLPNLQMGHSWETRAANPLAKLPGPFRWLVGRAAEHIVRHEVVAIEPVIFEDRSLRCFVVKHSRLSETTRSWVSVVDGRVLRHEFTFAGKRLTLHRLSDSN